MRMRHATSRLTLLLTLLGGSLIFGGSYITLHSWSVLCSGLGLLTILAGMLAFLVGRLAPNTPVQEQRLAQTLNNEAREEQDAPVDFGNEEDNNIEE